MREVRTDDEKILFVEVRLQRLSYILEHAETLGADYDRHDGRNFLEDHLQERQLDLEAMLFVVGVAPEGERAASFLDEFLPEGNIDRHPAQGRLGIGILRVHACAGKPHPMAWPEEEYPLVRVPLRDAAEGGGRHFAAEHVPRVGYDHRLRRQAAVIGRMQPFSQHRSDLLFGGRIERAGNCRSSHFLCFRIT